MMVRNMDEGIDNTDLVCLFGELDCGEFPGKLHSVRAIIARHTEKSD